MCAALAAASDPAAELQLAVDLINRVVDGVRSVRTALHVCRGNWSRNEDVLLSGDYAPLLPHLARMQVDQFVLEYATEDSMVQACCAGEELRRRTCRR